MKKLNLSNLVLLQQLFFLITKISSLEINFDQSSHTVLMRFPSITTKLRINLLVRMEHVVASHKTMVQHVSQHKSINVNVLMKMVIDIGKPRQPSSDPRRNEETPVDLHIVGKVHQVERNSFWKMAAVGKTWQTLKRW